MAMSETEMLLKGYGLTTAEFYYGFPDHPTVISPPLIFQEYDVAPDFPWLFDKIEWWQKEIDGPLHYVSFTHRKLISPGEWRNITGEFTLH